MCVFLQRANVHVVLEISQGCLNFIASAKGETESGGVSGTFGMDSIWSRILAVAQRAALFKRPPLPLWKWGHRSPHSCGTVGCHGQSMKAVGSGDEDAAEQRNPGWTSLLLQQLWS